MASLPFNRDGRRSPYQLGGPLAWLMIVPWALFVIVLLGAVFSRGTLEVYFYLAQLVVFPLWWYSLADFRRFTDMRRGQVASVEGVVQRSARQKENGVWDYTLTIGDKRFKVSRAVYDALAEPLVYRLYYAVRGRRLLNAEPVGEM